MSSTEEMRKVKELQAAEKHTRVYKTIRQMLRDGEKVNFYTVADRAGVSRTYLYRHGEFKTFIKKCDDFSSLDNVYILEEKLKEQRESLKRAELSLWDLSYYWEKVDD